MLKRLVILFCVLGIGAALANMASPIEQGSKLSSVFINQYVEIVQEHILITPTKNLLDARIDVRYNIFAGKSGIKIPLLFYADRYHSAFTATLDGRAVELRSVPEDYFLDDEHALEGYNYLNYEETDELVSIEWPEGTETVFLKDLVYFEVDLDSGSHTIDVLYNTETWVDGSDWTREYSIYYSLSPAKSWKSFGELFVEVDNSEAMVNWDCNLGPTFSSDSRRLKWRFSDLPEDKIELRYKARVNPNAQTLINLGPLWLSILMILPLAILHFIFISLYRKSNKEKKFSWVQIVGSMTLPLLWVIFYMSSFDLIDWSIGEHASKRHGYTFMAMAFYPIILPLYFLVTWFFDNKMRANSNERF